MSDPALPASARERELEERLRDLTEAWRRLGDNLPSGAIYRQVASPEGVHRFTAMSRGIEDISGIPAEEVLRDFNALYAIVHPDDRAALIEANERSRRALTPLVMEFRQRHRRTGMWRWTLARSFPHREPDGSTVWDGVTLDITELVEAREALAGAARREAELARDFELTFEHAPVGVAMVGLDGRILRANRALCELLGYPRAELSGVALAEILHRDEDPRAVRDALLRGEMTAEGVVRRYRRKDGAAVEAVVHGALVHDPAGTPLHYVAHVVDMTERRRLEAELLLRDRLAALGTLAAGAAHEINNPLASITSNLEYLRGVLGGDLPAPVRAEAAAAAGEALTAAARVRDIVAQLRSFASLDSGAAGGVDPRRSLVTALDLAGPALGRHARVVRALGEVPRVACDEGRLAQVFLAVLVNAGQALPAGEAGSHEVRVTTRTDARGRAVVEVQDTGPGFGESALAHAFDPFFTTRPVGAGKGLGLAIAHGVVTGAGGEITLENRTEGGATVRITLPPVSDLRAADGAA